MKKLTALFSLGVLGIVVCFVMSVATALRERSVELPEASVRSFPGPALNR